MKNNGRPGCLLLHDGEHWVLGYLRNEEVRYVGLIHATGPCTDSNETTSENRRVVELASAVRSTLTDLDDGESLLLALPASWFLAASIATEGLPRRDRREAMSFRLEERLPVAADDLAIAFARPVEGRCLGVALHGGRLDPLLEALDNAGLSVQGVCPLGLLAIQNCQEPLPGDAIVLTAIGDDHVEIIRIRDGAPNGWVWTRDSVTQLTAHLLADTEPPRDLERVVAVGRIESLSRLIDNLKNNERTIELLPVDESPPDLAVRSAARILSGEAEPWINLSPRPALWSLPTRLVRPLAAAASAWLILLVLTNLSLYGKGIAYRSRATAQRAALQQTFVETFPGQDRPVDVRARLESERRALNDAAGLGAGPGRGASALTLLRHSIAALPDEPRHRVLSLSIDPREMRIEGQARSHTDAETLTGRLREGVALNVEPPQTRRIDDRSVSFILRASLQEPSGQTRRGGPR